MVAESAEEERYLCYSDSLKWVTAANVIHLPYFSWWFLPFSPFFLSLPPWWMDSLQLSWVQQLAPEEIADLGWMPKKSQIKVLFHYSHGNTSSDSSSQCHPEGKCYLIGVGGTKMCTATSLCSTRYKFTYGGVVFFPLLLEFFVMCAAALYYVMQTGRASGSQRAAERAPLGGWMCFVEHGNSVSLCFKETMLL